MMLQKRNSGGLKCWGCSAFEVLATVAIERPATVSRALRPCSVQASTKSAILHSCIMTQEVRGNAAIMPNYVNIDWEKCFCPFPFGNSLIRAESLGGELNSGNKLADLIIGTAELVESSVTILNEVGSNMPGETSEKENDVATISVTDTIRTDRHIVNGNVVETTVSARKDTVVKIEDIMKVLNEKRKKYPNQ